MRVSAVTARGLATPLHGQHTAREGRDVAAQAAQATTANYANCIRLRYNENMCVGVQEGVGGCVWVSECV